MARAPFLTSVEQAKVDVMHQLGLKLHEMSRQLGRSRNAIRRYVNDPINYGKNQKQFAGRQKKLTSREERNIIKTVSNSPKSLNEVKRELNLCVCRSTVHNVINRSNTIVRQKMMKVPKMTSEHKEKRLKFVKVNMATKWENIVFSDEKKWNLDGPDGNRSYWRDIRKDPQMFSKRNFGGGSLIIWGAFCNGKKLDLQFITTKENSVSYQSTLQKAIVPFFRNRRNTHIFQQDNASIHVSNSTRDYPDLNPIENLWGILARRVYRHGKQFNTIQDLKVAIKAEWDAITEAELKTLVASMPNRVIEVIQKHGGETNY
uniref:HTH_Tnp_Tc3_1 domain-containing protein n=1 Tax=Caenorhabditis japonica TaxID=281687 RepID=A0A8R1HYW8_CAEJA